MRNLGKKTKLLAKKIMVKIIYLSQLLQVGCSIYIGPRRNVGLYQLPNWPNIAIERNNSTSFSKRQLITAVNNHKVSKNFTKKEVELLYDYASKLGNSSITKEELINKFMQVCK